ncbi:3-dehydroquinate synthase [Sandaracinobacteroides saxicola]|uniref:3-dehydroquinate synthase n=1 Tax=Sandaracinobacteroides saxicola TaxID=2759707 RepID=A0A7G5IJD6_9SPHN|nr:3-dehydroquinate synthase [Sandaracinobacteroides saxicola]QMW23478.1 3-dehydroquinate synthase [Sandaracinobacteroides saxicola]
MTQPLIVPVALGDRGYDIHVADGLLARAGALVAPLTRSRRIAVVTDENVWPLHGAALRRSFEAAGLGVHPLVLGPGEASKSFTVLADLCDALLALDITRADAIVAFGGGVIGDLTGFAAAILKRGTGFVQMPTTLLAMVDSSVGGKTGINTAAGKNLVGAFHQPRAVIADTALLATLPPRERQAGYAEIVKYGLINDPAFFDWCEAQGRRVLALEPDAVAHAVAQSCRAKAAVVAADERETADVRALLNLGHTFGHALEAETGFGTALLHGEAVAIGMAQAFRFSAARGLCPPADAERVVAHLAAAGLRTRAAEAGITADAAPRLVAHMLHDKKKLGDTLPFILARGIGQAFVAKDVALAEVERFLADELRG